MPSVDDLLGGLASRGLYLANLFQYQPPTGGWRWQANLTDGTSVWEFGRGDTAQAALMNALVGAITRPPAVRRAKPTPPPVDLESEAPGPAVNEDDLPF